MKKSYLYSGLVMTAAGVCFLLLAALTEYALEPLLWGLCGGSLGGGLGSIFKYIDWSHPEHREEYAQRLERERISMGDERKIMLRDKSGAVTYRLSLLICAFGAFAFSIAAILGVSWARSVTMTLGILLITQYVLGLLVYRRLEKRF